MTINKTLPIVTTPLYVYFINTTKNITVKYVFSQMKFSKKRMVYKHTSV